MSTQVEAAFREGAEGPSPAYPVGHTDAYIRTFSRILAALRLAAATSVDDEKLVALADARAAAILRGE